MGCADGLSRLPISAVTRSASAKQPSTAVDPAGSANEPPAPTVNDTPDPELPPYNDDSYSLPTLPLASAQAEDPFIIAMKAYIQDSALPADPSLMTLVTRTRDHYAIQGHILCRRVILKTPIRNPELQLVPVIPLGWTRRVLQLCHDSPLAGHFGVARTIDRDRRVAYLLGLQSDVHEYCQVCSTVGPQKDLAPGAKVDFNACRSTSSTGPSIFSSSTPSGHSRSPRARTDTCSYSSTTSRAGRRPSQYPISKPPPSHASWSTKYSADMAYPNAYSPFAELILFPNSRIPARDRQTLQCGRAPAEPRTCRALQLHSRHNAQNDKITTSDSRTSARSNPTSRLGMGVSILPQVATRGRHSHFQTRVPLAWPLSRPLQTSSNTYRVYLPSLPDRDFPVNVDRLKPFQGYWSRPYDEDIPDRLRDPPRDQGAAISQGESDYINDEPQSNPDIANATIELDMLPPSIFTDRVTFSDNDEAYTNTDSPIKDIADKRWIAGKEIEYLVTHADGTQHWTPRSRLQEYRSFIQEYEDRQRSSQGLPPLRRSPRLTELDLAPEPPPEY
ncbi:hypothetical protein AC1031_011046 [Aphanomyces cochlioides]|nr:hypothetical protein AC1031_011046 [Aphanomyces cochlioides]